MNSMLIREIQIRLKRWWWKLHIWSSIELPKEFNLKSLWQCAYVSDFQPYKCTEPALASREREREREYPAQSAVYKNLIVFQLDGAFQFCFWQICWSNYSLLAKLRLLFSICLFNRSNSIIRTLSLIRIVWPTLKILEQSAVFLSYPCRITRVHRKWTHSKRRIHWLCHPNWLAPDRSVRRRFDRSEIRIQVSVLSA